MAERANRTTFRAMEARKSGSHGELPFSHSVGQTTATGAVDAGMV